MIEVISGTVEQASPAAEQGRYNHDHGIARMLGPRCASYRMARAMSITRPDIRMQPR